MLVGGLGGFVVPFLEKLFGLPHGIAFLFGEFSPALGTKDGVGGSGEREEERGDDEGEGNEARFHLSISVARMMAASAWLTISMTFTARP